nr:antitoxin endoai [Saccharococcus thermophilus]
MEVMTGCSSWRCIFVSESSATTEIVVRLPQSLVTELDVLVKQENGNRNELIYQATKMYIRERKKRHIREAMRRGYMEMAKINLSIASEAFLAEYEADHTVERLVSGG